MNIPLFFISYFLLSIFVFINSSCTKLASDFDSNSSIEEITKTAEQAHKKKDYTRAAEIYLKIDEFYPYTDSSRAALVKAIRFYHTGAQFNDLRATAKKYLELYPSDENSAFAKYMVAMSHFEQIIDVERDQGATRDSIKEFNELIRLYPKSKYSIKAEENILIATSQLAGQEVSVGKYYLNKNNPLSAIKRFNTVIHNYKNTPHYPEALFRTIEAYTMIGVYNKVKIYAKILNREFPNSEWNKLSFKLIQDYDIRVN